MATDNNDDMEVLHEATKQNMTPNRSGTVSPTPEESG
jgi:hypothetical protein